MISLIWRRSLKSTHLIYIFTGNQCNELNTGMRSLSLVLDNTWEAAFRTNCTEVNYTDPLWKK